MQLCTMIQDAKEFFKVYFVHLISINESEKTEIYRSRTFKYSSHFLFRVYFIPSFIHSFAPSYYIYIYIYILWIELTSTPLLLLRKKE